MSCVTKVRSTLNSELVKLSKLDIDDLIIMSLMLEERTYTEICGILRLTPPAISHRLLKYIDVYGNDFFVFVKHKKCLSDLGKLIAKKARKALCSFLEVEDELLFINVKF